MSTPILALQHDPASFINYIGSDPEYYPDSGPVVLPALHTARVSGYDLDNLELASAGKVTLTTNGSAKALEVRGLGVADPAVIDTTVLDAGTNELVLQSSTGTKFSADQITFNSDTAYHATIDVANASDPTFHHYATPTSMVVGTGTLDANNVPTSGAFLSTTADSFSIGHDTASIKSDSAADSRIRYEATQAHEFFVGSDAATQAQGTGAIEITADKVIIRKDVDLTGTINSISTDTTSLEVEDQVIRLAHTDDPATANRDVLLSQSKTGFTIDTVPGSYADDASYMGGFVDAGGAKLFVDDTNQVIDVTKARDSGVFTKEIAFYLNQGAKSSGARNATSRLNEPYWQLTGGALHMSHTVPAGDGKAKKFSLGFRISDDGSMEMVRLTRNLEWDDAATTYVPDTTLTDTAKVMARYVNAQ